MNDTEDCVSSASSTGEEERASEKRMNAENHTQLTSAQSFVQVSILHLQRSLFQPGEDTFLNKKEKKKKKKRNKCNEKDIHVHEKKIPYD